LDPQCLDPSIANLIGLSNLSENALLHNLRIRFNCDEIYTFVSSILIAINPFRQLPLYGVEILERYKTTSDKSTLPPHIFSVADTAFKVPTLFLSPVSLLLSLSRSLPLYVSLCVSLSVSVSLDLSHERLCSMTTSPSLWSSAENPGQGKLNRPN
jgi:hypothetical protein